MSTPWQSVSGLVLKVAFALAVALDCAGAQTVQQHVHARSHSVMPFEMSKSVHLFRMTETGGRQSVIVRDAVAADQIALIREHLRHEAARFARGDFSDPAHLHGAGMPGLVELSRGAAALQVTYVELPLGAAVVFTTSDLSLLTAVHRWFGAQLSEHGADARAE